MTEALLTLICLGASATLMGFFLMLVRRVFGKRLPGVFYYLAWLVVLLRFVVPLPGLIPVGAAETTPEAIPAQAARPYGSTWNTGASGDDYDGYLRTYNRTSAAADEETMGDRSAEAAAGAGNAGLSWSGVKRVLTSPRLWCAVWLIGAAVSAVRYIVGYYRFVRAIRRTEREPTDEDLALYFAMPGKNKPGLVRSRCVSSPMLMGVFRPTLVLPCREYTPDMLTNIFRHELTHYRRGDVAYKWFSAFVFSVYWFDPAVPFFRRELDRVCELSCDERVIRAMSDDEKQSYGETLLALASRRTARTSVLATSFATQKRDLRERLEQIMTFKTKSRASLALALAAVLLLAGCGAALAPSTGRGTGSADAAQSAPAGETPAPGALRLVTVSSVDELLGAIGSNTVITVRAGRYDLTSAADYGTAGADAGAGYTWSEAYDGYELEISGVSNLTIKADGDVEITTLPRYANVIRLSSCTGVTLSGLTLGHEEAPGYCAGNVVRVDSSTDIAVNSCGLYGCGVVGVYATNSQHVFINDSDIYECTQNAVIAHSCRDVRVTGCRVYDCGNADYTSDLFYAESTTALAVVNCEITGNSARSLMGLTYSIDCVLLGTEVRDNSFSGALLDLHTANDIAVCLTVSGCEFDVPAAVPMYSEGSSAAVDTSGAALTEGALRAMTLEKTVYAGPAAAEPAVLDSSVDADGVTTVRAATVDEFLAAIAPNTVIYLDAETFDLSTATSYGGYGSNYYYWLNDFDGPGLVITGVENLSIISENNATIAAIPRYANVLGFRECCGVTLSGFTAGHTEEPGSCSGGVLYFDACSDISITECRLYGCGTVGIQADTSHGLDVRDTEIYDCSSCAVNLISCTGAVFTNCNIHDCGTPELYFDGSSSLIYDGAELAPAVYAIGADGAPVSLGRYDNGLIIYYQADRSGEIVSECTLHVGESVTLYARYADGTIPQNLAWLSSPETALNLSYIGNTCEVTAVQEASGGVTLEVIDTDRFQPETPRPGVTVYVVP